MNIWRLCFKRSFCCFPALLLVVPVGLLVPLEEAAAQVRCRAEVHYSWKRAVDDQEAESSPRKLLFSTVEVDEPTEAMAKMKIQSLLSKEAFRARQECLRQHENLSGCISGKFQALSATMRQLDFEARREIQKSIRDDCNNQQGECLKAFWEEISCSDGGAEEAS